MWSAELKKDLLSDMFSTEEVLSQGDIKNLEVEKFSGQLDHQHFLDQDFMNLKFLDTFTGISDLSSMDTDINVDLKELLGDVLASEYADSSFLNTDTVIPSLIPVSELSYDLNTTLQGDPISLEAAIPARELSYDLKTSNDVQLVNNSLEISACGEVSSTTNTLYDLLDERASSSCSFVDEVDMSGGSEVVEESAAGRKYLEMRRKNNIASQRSRKIRKQKNSKMSDRLKELEKENKELSLLAEGLEKERNTLQELLMSIIAKKS